MKKFTIFILVLISFNIVFAQEEYNGCPMEGDATSPGKQAVNRLKNRYELPQASDFNNNVTLRRMIARGNDRNRFSNNDAVTIEGYITHVKQNGIEDCNCFMEYDTLNDIHINMNTTNTFVKRKSVVIEISPRLRRAVFTQLGVTDLDVNSLKDVIENKKVRVTGWLMFDKYHTGNAVNTANPRNTLIYRATCWEVHPITSIELVD